MKGSCIDFEWFFDSYYWIYPTDISQEAAPITCTRKILDFLEGVPSLLSCLIYDWFTKLSYEKSVVY